MALPSVTTVRNGQGPRDRLAEGEEMLRDRALGLQVSELCAKYGVSRATLYRRLDDAVKARIAPTVDAYRESENRLLDDLMSRWQKSAAAAAVMIEAGTREENMSLVERGMARNEAALMGMLRVHERRSRLNGLDAPVKTDVHLTVSTPIDDAVAALAAEVEAAAS